MPISLQGSYKKLLSVAKDVNALPDASHSLKGSDLEVRLQNITISLEVPTTVIRPGAGSLENDIIRLTLLIICWKLLNTKSPADFCEITQELEKNIRTSLDYMTIEHMRLLLWCCYVAGSITSGATRKWYTDTVYLIGGQAGCSWQSTKRTLRDFIWIDRSQSEWKRLWQDSRR